MEGSEEEVVPPRPSNDVLRKKLEAELRATEEIARIRQSVIEKRLAVELATLGEEPPGGLRMYHQQPEMPSPAPKPLYPTIPKLAPVNQRRTRTLRRPILLPGSEVYLQEATSSAFADVKLQKSPFSLGFRRSPASSIMIPSFRTFSRKHEIPDFFRSIPSDSRDDEEDEENEVEEETDENSSQPRRRASFFKGVMRKFKRRLRSEDREEE